MTDKWILTDGKPTLVAHVDVPSFVITGVVVGEPCLRQEEPAGAFIPVVLDTVVLDTAQIRPIYPMMASEPSNAFPDPYDASLF